MRGRNLPSYTADASVPSTAQPTPFHPSREPIDRATDPWMMIDPEAARPLWDRLTRARTESPIVSVAEDAVFRFYLPLAHSLARSSATPDVAPERAEQVAELGLARAVLAWRQRDCSAFVAFVRGVILHQLQAIPAGPTPARHLTAAMTTRHRRAS